MKPKKELNEMEKFHKQTLGFERRFEKGSIMYNTMLNMYNRILKSKELQENNTITCPSCKRKLKVEVVK